jgi:hypothetical protein
VPQFISRVGLLLFLSTVSVGTASAAVLEGVAMPDSQEVAGTSLVLNGLALRTYSLLRIRIYVAGLYLERPTSDSDAILASNNPKLLRFVFMRDVDAQTERKSWRESLDDNCGRPCSLPPENVDRFLDAIPSMRQGDAITFVFTPSGMDAFKNGGLIGRIHDSEFVHVILATFIGEHPTSPAVKRGLLGGS